MTDTRTAAPLSAPEALPGDELRAQYLACSYLVSACEQAIERMSTLTRASEGRSYLPVRALEIVRTIGDDWRLALTAVARAMTAEDETFTTR